LLCRGGALLRPLATHLARGAITYAVYSTAKAATVNMAKTINTKLKSCITSCLRHYVMQLLLLINKIII
ncbi:MAG: hypothetical protein RRY03_00635, partial [Oscillospiraceae bacterium]